MSFPTVVPRPHRVLYVFSVILTALFIMGFLWFALWSGVTSVRSAIASSMNQYDIANTTYSTYELSDTFLNNMWTYFLVIFIFGILCYVFIYAQRKNVSEFRYGEVE